MGSQKVETIKSKLQKTLERLPQFFSHLTSLLARKNNKMKQK